MYTCGGRQQVATKGVFSAVHQRSEGVDALILDFVAGYGDLISHA